MDFIGVEQGKQQEPESDIGRIVFSKRGRDKGMVFVIMDAESEYVYLADGKLRPVERPKKKKRKHIMPTNSFAGQLRDKIINKEYINNSDVRKALALYKNNTA